MKCFRVLVPLLFFVQTSFAQKEKLNIRPYTIATNFKNLSSHYDFLSSVQLDSSLEVEQLKDIVYKKTETSDLKLDAYIPERKNNEKLPGVLLIHGGGWFSGEKENLSVLAQALAANGYVAVTSSYRLGGEANYPAAVLDLKDALRWMRKNAKSLNLDVNRIASLGGSAGAQLAMQVALTPDSKIYNEEGQEFSSAVQGIVNIDGVTTFVHPEVEKGPLLSTWLGGTFDEKPEVWKEASPIEHVNSKTPPTLFINSAQPRFHGGRDSYIDLLDQYNIYSEVHTLKDTPHAFWLVNPWFKPTLRYTLDFLDKILKEPYTPAYRTIKVAKNDQADFGNIQDAINSVRVFGPGEVLIEIAAGVYNEKIVIPSHITKLTLKGSDRDKTIITNDDHAGKIDELTKKEHGTFSSYTLLVQGNDVHLEGLTIENTSCNEGQAVALHVEGDRFIAVNCKILGCQDTLYAAKEGSRQYFEQCFIQGTTDFIFGQSIAVFQDCVIKSLTNSYITAAATPRNQEFGFVFFKCKLIAGKDVTKVFLGRPWRPYAKTVFINTEMEAQILEEGWHSWPGDSMFPEKEKTAYYGEYESKGAGASPENRVEWAHQLGRWEIEHYNLNNIFDRWIPQVK